MLVRERKEGRLFISYSVRNMTGGTLNNWLKLLQTANEDIALQQKEATLHSIVTISIALRKPLIMVSTPKKLKRRRLMNDFGSFW